MYYYKEKNDQLIILTKKEKLRKAFLMAPVDYKISSRYSKSRKHMSGRWKGHFGTDYAAATGTQFDYADGVVIKHLIQKIVVAKIKHNNTYTTVFAYV